MDKLIELFKKHRKVCTDSREIIPGSIFFALKGENFDGNNFIEEALDKGCVAAVSDNQEWKGRDQRVLWYPNVLQALQNLAHSYRHSLRIPFLGITGSNGKTTSKELIRDVLSKKMNVYATHGNLNNHIGVPLTLLEIEKDTEFAIIEMGANHQGEIRELSSIADPDYGYITNIGKAHLEGFGGPEGVKKGKRELFDHIIAKQGTLFVNASLDHLLEISEGANRIVYGLPDSEHYFKVESTSPELRIKWIRKSKENLVIPTQLTGEYNIGNIAAAAVIGTYFGIVEDKIIQAISAYRPTNNRSQKIQGKHNLIILDAYNANPNSMEGAVKNLHKLDSASGFAILGAMKEMGKHADEEHLKLLEQLDSLSLSAAFVGKEFMGFQKRFDQFIFLPDTESAVEYFKANKLRDRTVLLKGSRSMALERLKDLF